MKFDELLTPSAMGHELGERLKRARLNLNLTQEEVALSAGISRFVVKKLEQGDGKVQDLMALLIALDSTDQLNNLMPPQLFSPIQILKLRGKIRKRASSTKRNINKNKNNSNPEIDIGW